MKSIPAIVIHGGAWAIPDRMSQSSHQGVIQAARVGFQILDRGGSAVDAVEAAVMCLEDDPVFDAGKRTLKWTSDSQCYLRHWQCAEC